MGYGGKYGQQYGLDEPFGEEPTGFVFRRDETVTAVDTLPAHWLGRLRREDETVTAVDDVVWAPRAYNRREDETATATDGVDEILEDAAADRDTTAPVHLKPYEPLVDLNMVEARLTNRARYYIARGLHDGTLLQPVRYELGAGWENPRWGEPPKPSPDATEVANLVHEGSIWDGQMLLEEANASTLAIRCAGPDEPSYNPTELMVYAEIRHSSIADENFHQIPFACATFPSWFHTTDQRFITRIILPLGYGARVEKYQRPPIRIIHEDLFAVDTVTVETDFDVFATGGE
ncbi:MAG: hypothetical protein GWN58_23570 [Anaerolineae bacterium]|nr:hypothetical protein [Thermoplasmata archaeon]NIV32311.1 hypothetical protein [Anaerolineae bacterium]NIY03765.1 hypothetical protein [Thermoplasmata archaeon]